jgi:hypothetical protein
MSKNQNSKNVPSKGPAPKSAPAMTVSRNTPIPRPTAVKREITHEMIAKRAYEIFVSGKGGSQTDNWFRAERELKAT